MRNSHLESRVELYQPPQSTSISQLHLTKVQPIRLVLHKEAHSHTSSSVAGKGLNTQLWAGQRKSLITYSDVIWVTSWREVKPAVRKLSLYWTILMALSQSSTVVKAVKSGMERSSRGWEGLVRQRNR